MQREDPSPERRRFQLVGAAIVFVVVATLVAFFVVVILPAGNDEAPAAAATPTPTPPAAPDTETPPPDQGPRLARPIELRSGPGPGVAIVTRLAETDGIRVLGRSPQGDWFAVGLAGRPDVSGWVPADAVLGLGDAATLPVIEASGATPTPPTGTLTPDLPDLVVADVYSRDNHLMVRVLNQGAGDAMGDLLIAVNGRDPVALDVKPGEPIRPGQTLDAPVPGRYLQLRQAVIVLLVPTVDRPEEDEANNAWEGFVEPDQPNDIETTGVEFDEDGLLVVSVRNNSPIPLVGDIIVSVRETPPSIQLLGRVQETVEIGAGETLEFRVEDIPPVSVTQMAINATMNAIQDSDIANNFYPR